ncbi:aminopeptidase [Streptomyces sp. MAR4 CNX-425]|uniref:aminopeptidase n=1 Tax=Streptomyces sp. MAR4 CNX-425 TaxID=3406343 RepID=UPI003B5101DB
MRRTLGWLLSLAVLTGTVGLGSSPVGAATADDTDIKDRLLSIEGVSLIEEKPADGYRYFVLNYTQPVDHRKPHGRTFQQRFTVLHKDTDRPTVFATSGYNVSTTPRRSEPAQIVDGNQVSMEYRFFTPSRPDPADWSKLDIWQAASDQHRLHRALNDVYDENWLATGGSKGGMTATYYERFYPRDMDGAVVYVAPNDVVNREDSAYDRFFERVGTKECRDALNAVQREALVRRDALSEKYAAWAAESGATFRTTGSLDKAFEATVLDLVWGFWQYSSEADCADVPDAATVSDQGLYDYIDTIAGWSFYTDQGLAPYTPYYYQAGTELGAPTIQLPHLKDLSRYGYQPPRTFVPRDIDMRFKPWVMNDIDKWVRKNAHRMLFIYGENDPWGAEPFRLGRGARDSYVYTVPGANHGARVGQLPEDERAKATERILDWADVGDEDGDARAKPLATYDSGLDRVTRKELREQSLRP